jgi:peptidoglycan/LPS O-acetylase OafA/YrhL
MNAPYRPDPQVQRLTAYRPFIDGLRAVSILAVVLYHVGIPGITGGYVGVDVFFVISGFLIISQITEALDENRFRFGEFWARRALRILPPYLLVLAVSTAVAPLILVMPEEMTDFGRQAAYSALMVVNHLFLRQQGYFDTPADLKPLLHLWSLSVEEQFYLAAPLMLSAVYVFIRRSKRADARNRWLGWSAMTVFAASFAACIALTRAGGHNYAFYLTPLRAWQFVAGSSMALLLPWAQRRLSPAQLSAMASAGLAAIVVAAVAYSPATPYPSVFAALPVLGAAGVILAGLTHPGAPVVRLLGARPLVYLGLVSYSWYLWHWPLLAFARILHFGERLLWLDALLGLASLGLATATYHLLEKPIREWRRRAGRRLSWTPVLAGIVACVLFAGGGKMLAGFVAQSRTELAGDLMPPSIPTNPVCQFRLFPTVEDCLELTHGRRLGLLIGDSQAQAALGRLAGFASGKGSAIVSWASNGCVAITGIRVFMFDKKMEADCMAVTKAAAALLAGGIKPEYAILYSRWPLYGTGAGSFALGAADATEPAADQEAAFVDGLRATILGLRSLGARRILVLGPTPLFSRPAPRCLYLARKYSAAGEQACGVSRADHEALGREAVRRIRLGLAGLDGVRYVDPTDDFCNDQVCLPYFGDDVLFVDTNHLSDAGADRLIAGHRADFEWVIGDTQP